MNKYTFKQNRHRLVHVIDANRARCENLTLLFRLEGYEAMSSSSEAQFVERRDRRPPDVVVINMRLGVDNGLTLLRHVKASYRGTMVVMVGEAPSTDTVVAAMKLGAVDVLAIPVDHENLLRVVREGLQADVHFHAAKGGRRAVDVLGFGELTSREREVLQMVADGQSNKETGRALKISPRTVEVHRARVMAKLGARNAADLMRIVLTT